MIDGDPQGSLTHACGYDPEGKKITLSTIIHNAMRRELILKEYVEIEQLIRGTYQEKIPVFEQKIPISVKVSESTSNNLFLLMLILFTVVYFNNTFLN